MVLLDPKVLAEATSAFLSKAQKQAEHDPGAISRLVQENETLRGTIATLEGRLDQESATSRRREKDLEDLHERVVALEDQASEHVEAAWELHERVSSLETINEGTRTIPGHTARKEATRNEGARKEARRQNSRFKAFEAHFLAMRKKYHVKKPGKDHRPFIWSFIEGIDDKEWAQYTQEYLMKTLPDDKVHRSKSPRNGRIMALDLGVKWEDVRDAMSRMQVPPSLA
ncbi:hypothetical protein VMCG_01136 [Cytospora schulzeri]|uniref:Uncharacterized protein n=1 Tax=Cytospora schulzeri TaxID=448051 RepID=A0A423X5I7_9PEZI|nr:hypothetical protein VMCG_01136 [Valsa malicola]